MPPEQLGIVQSIEQAKTSPDKYAAIIAARVVRMTLEGLREKRRNSPGELTIEELLYLDSCDDKTKLEGYTPKITEGKKYTLKSIDILIPAVKALILEYAAGKTIEQIKIEYKIRTEAARDTREGKTSTPAQSELEALEAKSSAQLHTSDINIVLIPKVVGAVLSLLADTMRNRKGKSGMHELAHYLHNQPHSEHILFDETRQQLIDHGIIHANRIMHKTGQEQQLWIGHDTSEKYEGRVSKQPNVIVLLSQTGGKYSVTSLLKADDIYYNGKSHILGLKDGFIQCHDIPKIDDQGGYSITPITPVFDFQGDMENVKHSEIPQTPWDVYEITGKKPEEHRKKVTKTTLFIDRENPQNSFQSSSAVHKFEGFNFLIQEETGDIIIFSSAGTTTLSADIRNVVGFRPFISRSEYATAGTPNITVNGFYFINKQNKKKKVILNIGNLQVVDVSPAEEEKFFE